MPAPLRMGLMEWGLLLVLSLLWGASFLFGRMAVLELPTFTVVLARVALAAAVLVVVVQATRGSFPSGLSGWAPFAVMGLLNNVIPFGMIFGGQSLGVGAGLAAVLNATTPLFTGLIAHALTADEKLTANKLAGILLGVAGVAVLIGPEIRSGLQVNLLAQGMILAGALSYGFAGVWGRRFRGVPPLTSATAQLLCSTAILAPITLVADRPWTLPLPSTPVIAALVALAVLSTALAYVIFFMIVRRAGATNVMLVTLMIPPSAMFLGWLVLGEHPDASDLAGAAIIAVALLVIDGRMWSWFSRRSAPMP